MPLSPHPRGGAGFSNRAHIFVITRGPDTGGKHHALPGFGHTGIGRAQAIIQRGANDLRPRNGLAGKCGRVTEAGSVARVSVVGAIRAGLTLTGVPSTDTNTL